MKTRRNRLSVLAAVSVITTAASMAPAATIWKVTFDNAPVGTPPATYTLGANDISPANAVWTYENIDAGSYAQITAATGGLQGGNAYYMSNGGGWGSHGEGGYRLSGTGGQSNFTAVGSGFTLETVANLSNVGGHIIFTSWQLYFGLDLVQGTGSNAQLKFFGGSQGATPATTGLLPICDSDYHHFAAVYTRLAGGMSTIDVYVDGQIEATNTYSESTNLMNYDAMVIGNGQYAWPHNVIGYIDAAAYSNAPLAPADFVFPIPEPASLGLLALGGLMIAGRRRR